MKKPYLFTYWENKPGSVMPEYMKLCEKTMERNCGQEFEIVHLDEKTIFDWIPDLRKDVMLLPTIAHKIDVCRFELLYRYGGVYLDKDFIILKSLKSITSQLEQYDFIASGKIHPTIDCPSIGFMAANKGFDLGKKHLDEIYKIIDNMPSSMGWCCIGTDLLKKYVNDYKYLMLPDIEMFPVPWWKWQYLFEQSFDENAVMNSSTIGVALYNNQFQPWFKDLTMEQVLNTDIPISRLLKRGLTQ
jgi:mannosyltransferase OCH1-like enzyme